MEFTYSLEAILEHKRRVEKEHFEELSRVEQQHQHEAQLVEKLRVALGKCGLLPADGWDYQTLVEYWELLITEIDQANLRINQIEEQIELNRAKLIEAAVDRKKFERHRDNELSMYIDALQKKEQAYLDELSGLAFLRQQRAK